MKVKINPHSKKFGVGINWKIVGISLGLILLLLWILYYAVTSPDINLLGLAPPEKITEFKAARIAGWESGKKLWELYADQAWSTKFGRETIFENVEHGTVYKKGEIVVKNLRAKRVKIFKYSKNVEAFKFRDSSTEEGYLEAEIDLSRVSTEENKEEKPRIVLISADHLRYDQRVNKTYLDGAIKVEEKDLMLLGKKVEADHDKKIIEVLESPKLSVHNSTITGGKIIADFDGGNFIVEEHAEVIQENKAAVARYAEYDKEGNTITMTENVELIIEKGTAILSEEAVKDLRNPEAKETLKEKTILRCQKLLLQSNGRNAFATGGVTVTQKEKSARANQAEYLSEEEIIILTGAVTLKKGEEWIKTKKVIVSVEKETFEATGAVETKFKLKK